MEEKESYMLQVISDGYEKIYIKQLSIDDKTQEKFAAIEKIINKKIPNDVKRLVLLNSEEDLFLIGHELNSLDDLLKM